MTSDPPSAPGQSRSSGLPSGQQGAKVDWSGVDIEAARTILRQGELYLDGQARLALAADQRALSAASVFSGFAAVTLAATLGYWTQTQVTALLWAGLVTAGLMVIGAFSCMSAARPVKFALPGSVPRQWWPVRKENLSMIIGGETENYQQLIEHNNAILKRNAQWFRVGFALGVSAPLLGALTWFVMQANEFLGQCGAL